MCRPASGTPRQSEALESPAVEQQTMNGMHYTDLKVTATWFSNLTSSGKLIQLGRYRRLLNCLVSSLAASFLGKIVISSASGILSPAFSRLAFKNHRSSM